MREIVLATRNRDKVREIKKILKGFILLSLDDFPGTAPVEETGRTLRDNALMKARKTAEMTGKISLADDSGLEVEALGGLPGAQSARFAGPQVSYEDNNRKLLKLMEGKTNRAARFRCVIALASPCGKTMTREGVCEGEISCEPRGGGGFGYDPVFIVKGAGKTFAEMSGPEKNSISHRAVALEEIKNYLQKFFSML